MSDFRLNEGELVAADPIEKGRKDLVIEVT